MDFKAPLIKGIIKDVIRERQVDNLNTKSRSLSSFKGPVKKTLNINATQQNIQNVDEMGEPTTLPSYPSEKLLKPTKPIWEKKKVHVSVIDDICLNKIEEAPSD